MSVCQECGLERTDCDCSLGSSDTIDIKGSGSVLNPFYALPNINPDDDNLLSYSASGLLAQLPAEILSPPRCQAYNSANISVPTDDRTLVSLNSERYDSTGSMHDNATNNSRIVIPVDGIYTVSFRGSFAANIAGDRGAYIRKNGSEYMSMQQKPATNNASIESGLICSVTDFFEQDEFLEALVQQDGAATLNLLATRYSPILTVTYRRRSPHVS